VAAAPGTSAAPGSPLARLLATWFGCGRSPYAPGTVGSLGALPVHFLLVRCSPLVHLLGVLASIAVGIWAAQRYASDRGEKDPQSAVIDEVAGTLIALGLTRGQGLWAQAAGLVLFRVFDIWKPGPIHRAESVPPLGLGIMLDDLLAGLVAGLIAHFAARLLAGG
jgi:phosphatidylglycerophosphatase A